MKVRHFLSLLDLSRDEIEAVLARGAQLRTLHRRHDDPRSLAGRVLAMVFEKSSTRTRVSFEAGMFQLGGHALFLSPRDTQLGRGEAIEDTARVLSRMVDVIMVRTFGQDRLDRFAGCSEVPVINALTDLYHPCQVLADLQTFVQHRGSIAGRRVAWIGDGNNMCHSYINAAGRLGFDLRVACPAGYEPLPEVARRAGAELMITDDPVEAAREADLLVTDVWASMGQEQERARRIADFAGFRIDARLLESARSDALVMHCLPAHRGEEISAAVIDDPGSVIWDEAENRLHAQKALLEFLLLR